MEWSKKTNKKERGERTSSSEEQSRREIRKKVVKISKMEKKNMRIKSTRENNIKKWKYKRSIGKKDQIREKRKKERKKEKRKKKKRRKERKKERKKRKKRKGRFREKIAKELFFFWYVYPGHAISFKWGKVVGEKKRKKSLSSKSSLDFMRKKELKNCNF